MKRNYMCFFLIIICALSFINPVKAYDYKYIDVGHEKLHVENRKILDSDGNEFVMNGIAIAQVFGSEYIKPERMSLETFTLLKEAGFNSIRFQVTSELFYNYSTHAFKESNLEALRTLMQNAEDAGIYIILDMHAVKDSLPNQFANSAGNEFCFVNADGGHPWTSEFFTVWEKLAETVKDYGSLLGYELLNEPQVCYRNEQTEGLDYYSNLLQTTVNKIRAIDPDTIISFQPVHNYRKYSDTSFYPYVDPEISIYPNVTGGNFLFDSRHEYNNLIYSQEYRVINMTAAKGIEVEKGNYRGYNSPGISNYTSFTDNMNLSQTVECVDPTNDCRFAWFVTDFIKFDDGGTVKINTLKIYQIDENNTEHLAFEASATDPTEKLEYFKISDLFNTYTLSNSNTSKLFWDPLNNLKIGITKGKKVRIEFNVDLTGYNSESKITYELNTVRVKPNANGYALVQGRDKLEDYFKYLDEVSARYGSPLYYGEFCLIAYYVNNYSNDRAYTDDFYDLATKYHLNWIWHRMSEYPSDNGFGAYINGITPTVANRRANQWEYDIPKLLSLKPEYEAEEINNSSEENTNNKEPVMNPKTGVQNCILIALIIIVMSSLVIHELKNKDKFKTNI